MHLRQQPKNQIYKTKNFKIQASDLFLFLLFFQTYNIFHFCYKKNLLFCSTFSLSFCVVKSYHLIIVETKKIFISFFRISAFFKLRFFCIYIFFSRMGHYYFYFVAFFYNLKILYYYLYVFVKREKQNCLKNKLLRNFKRIERNQYEIFKVKNTVTLLFKKLNKNVLL
jgi:hypothetical protein